MVASATLNAEQFSAFLKAPVMNVPGRLYPISVCYEPAEGEVHRFVEVQVRALLIAVRPPNSSALVEMSSLSLCLSISLWRLS